MQLTKVQKIILVMAMMLLAGKKSEKIRKNYLIIYKKYYIIFSIKGAIIKSKKHKIRSDIL